MIKEIAITLWWVFVILILIVLIIAVIKSVIDTYIVKRTFNAKEMTDEQALKILKNLTEILEEDKKDTEK